MEGEPLDIDSPFTGYSREAFDPTYKVFILNFKTLRPKTANIRKPFDFVTHGSWLHQDIRALAKDGKEAQVSADSVAALM